MAELLLRTDFRRKPIQHRDVYLRVYNTGLMNFSLFAVEVMGLKHMDRLAYWVEGDERGLIKTTDEEGFNVITSGRTLGLQAKPLMLAIVEWAFGSYDHAQLPLKMDLVKRPKGLWILRPERD